MSTGARTLHMDLESRSKTDLKKVGVYIYAADQSTEVLCCSYSINGGPIKRWRTWAGEKMPADLRKALQDPKTTVHSFNAAFERLILREVLKFTIPIHRWHCTQAKARAMALPGRLDLAARAANLPVQKGNPAIMHKWRAPLRNGEWADDSREYDALCDYCDLDVATEMALDEVLRDLTETEWRDYHISEGINDHGIPVDLPLVKAAQRYAEDEKAAVNRRLAKLTGDEVKSARQFSRLKACISKRLPAGYALKPNHRGKISLDAATRAELLEEDQITGKVRELIELVNDGGKASTSKFVIMERRASADQRVRGAFAFNGGGQTGRYSSNGVAVQNMVRAKLKNTEDVAQAICSGVPAAQLECISGTGILETLSCMARPSIIAEKGQSLVWGDWSGIEARACPWLSKNPSTAELLQSFARNEDSYIKQAGAMFKIPEIQVTKHQRQSAKVAVLSGQFGGGAPALQFMARNYGLKLCEAESEAIKTAWRAANPWAPIFWKELERAVLSAVRNPGSECKAGRVYYLYDGGVLWCLLPCGRTLAYPSPRIEIVDGKYGEQSRVTAIKGSLQPKRGSNEWPRQFLTRTVLCENVTQGTAASLLRWALRELTDRGWGEYIIMHVHDEIVHEVPDVMVEAAKLILHEVMTTGPAWSAGLPLAADISAGQVYDK